MGSLGRIRNCVVAFRGHSDSDVASHYLIHSLLFRALLFVLTYILLTFPYDCSDRLITAEHVPSGMGIYSCPTPTRGRLRLSYEVASSLRKRLAILLLLEAELLETDL